MGAFAVSLLHSLLWALVFLLLIPGLLVDLRPSERDLCVAVGVLLVGAGVVLFLASAYELSRLGGTTTVLKRSRKLVRSGVYGYTRNPVYLSVGLISLGEAFIFCSLHLFLYTILLMLGLHFWVLFFEEPLLRRSYGREFEDYSREVPRWVAFPRIWTCWGRRSSRRSSPRSP